jgi:glycosyltransferase involved in cell wall biosynthesis
MQVSPPPLVSVIVPAYRATRYIAEALDSALAQTFEDFEIVVVNDGCPDTMALEEALEPYRSRIIYVKQPHQGLAAARNTALASGSNTKYVALLDADDKWDPNYLRVQTDILEHDPAIDVVYCDAILFGEECPGGTFMEICPSGGEVTFRSLVDQTCNVMVSGLARREVVVRAGMFDPALPVSEDFDLWLRIVKKGGRIAYHHRTLVYYRRHPSSLSANRARMCNGFVAVLQKFLQQSDVSEPERELILNRIVYIQALTSWDEGIAAVRKGNSSEAVEKLKRANQVLRKPRLALLIAALRLIPWIAIPVYRVRQQMSRAR